MDSKLGRIAVRIGKELAECTLVGYSPQYALGLAVSLAIAFESINGLEKGTAQNLSVPQLLQWVRDLQKAKESELPKEDLIQ
jgi:hypothetical protein